MGASRGLGGLLCVACAVVVVLHIWFGYWEGSWGPGALAFALPVTAGVLVVSGLGFWLGWIMVTTRPAAPVTPPSPELEEVKAEKKPRKKPRKPRKKR